MRQKLISISQNLGLPSICILCNQFHKGSLSVCSFCIDLLSPLGTSCQRCAYPLENSHFLLCGNCIKKSPHFDNAYINYHFEEPLRSLIHQLKYHKQLYLAATLCHLMVKHFPKNSLKPQCLIPVPMHAKRIKERGFNQSALLTKLLSKQLKIPYLLNSCEKIINTPSQASLNSEERRKNLRNTFTTRPLPCKHIMLVDDLLTTGSTLNELAKSFKKSGVEQVDICCCARVIIEN